MGGLAHYIESAGIATTQVSLVRLHTEKLMPPRALWVPFELGRPFGPPNDAAFQRRVLTAALDLLDAPSGPVLEDYAEEAPAPDSEEAWVCPVNFAGPAADLSGEAALASAMQDEAARLMSWFELARERSGRTTFGISTLEPDAVPAWLGEVLSADHPATIGEYSPADSVRYAAEDLKALYFEAASAQPGAPDGPQVLRWFWRETHAAKVLLALSDRFAAAEDEALKVLGQVLLVPRAAHELLD